MSDLIKALIQVKDPLTLAAFLSVVLLLAFRTRKVPVHKANYGCFPPFPLLHDSCSAIV